MHVTHLYEQFEDLYYEYILKENYIYLFESVTDREKEREKVGDREMFFCLLVQARFESGQSQEPGDSSGFCMWVNGGQVLGPPSVAYPRLVTGSWIRSGADST